METNAKSKEGQNLVVVMPAFHEAERVGDTVRAVLQFCPKVVVVDDGSNDGTAEVAESAGADVVVHEENQGKGIALKTGFARALELGAELIATIDADGQHDPADLSKFVEEFKRQNVDVLVGNRMRANRNMPWIRRRTNQVMSWLLSKMMRQSVPDTQNGYRMYRTKVLPYIHTQSKGFAAESEQLLYLADQGLKIGSVSVRTIYSDEESSIHPLRDTVKFFKMILRYYHQPRVIQQSV